MYVFIEQMYKYYLYKIFLSDWLRKKKKEIVDCIKPGL